MTTTTKTPIMPSPVGKKYTSAHEKVAKKLKMTPAKKAEFLKEANQQAWIRGFYNAALCELMDDDFPENGKQRAMWVAKASLECRRVEDPKFLDAKEKVAGFYEAMGRNYYCALAEVNGWLDKVRQRWKERNAPGLYNNTPESLTAFLTAVGFKLCKNPDGYKPSIFRNEAGRYVKFQSGNFAWVIEVLTDTQEFQLPAQLQALREAVLK